MKKIYIGLCLSVVMLLLFQCKEAYDPEIVSTDLNYLVVEGFLNGNGQTSIKLSRTRSNASTAKSPELGAKVVIEADNSNRVILTEGADGNYTTNAVFSSALKYKLLIHTSAGKDYTSEFVSLLKTPAIDSLPWKRVNQGVQIYVNTHDAENKTKYYRWEFKETWIIIPTFYSSLKIVRLDKPNEDGLSFEIVNRTSADALPLACWQNELSTNIRIGSSSKLVADVINLAPVSFIPYSSWKLDRRYSILVKQYALTAAGFEYWENMKKNTEGLGSIFDPQPSEVKGNLMCVTDPNEPVIGYFDASTLEEKRLYISSGQVPDWRYRTGCESISVKNNPDSLQTIFPYYIPLFYQYDLGNNIDRYTGAPPECVDCRLKGSAIKPDFWE
ncbi:hypothetical protein ADIARSV_0275 [Arcticibacter svalbardensis MN12-7]|uniref:DUF4249 domain-containing protein n=1 Tax=Arcticibacter svalbardensis MN12-7 TaxID=1150600 RepID=R9GXS1_9SPHI|nr:DUF4249 domain-containing protein [Arcticibacter svalbardensis]EOR96546.1 hypothetical protein ADIARSV_0275 [Arcticibacter svalbardensis MN12-7]